MVRKPQKKFHGLPLASRGPLCSSMQGHASLRPSHAPFSLAVISRSLSPRHLRLINYQWFRGQEASKFKDYRPVTASVSRTESAPMIAAAATEAHDDAVLEPGHAMAPPPLIAVCAYSHAELLES